MDNALKMPILIIDSIYILTHYGLKMSFGDMDLGKHWSI